MASSGHEDENVRKRRPLHISDGRWTDRKSCIGEDRDRSEIKILMLMYMTRDLGFDLLDERSQYDQEIQVV